MGQSIFQGVGRDKGRVLNLKGGGAVTYYGDHIYAVSSQDTKTQRIIYSEMIGTMYPNLKALATICLTMNVTTAIVERSFSHTRCIEARLWNRSEFSFSRLMRISADSPEQLIV